MRMSHIIFLSVACPALSYVSTLSHRRHDIGVKKLENINVFFFIFSTTFVWNISHTYLLHGAESFLRS